MTRRISLALILHNHQPVGNFGWVIAETYERAYLPMLEAIERHPNIRLALHYTGPLLDWLRAERAAFLDRLGELVSRGQVEIVGGGWYEPVLAALPERDRVGQLRRMADELEQQFGVRPRGAWLAERVWEPDMPTALANAGYHWTVLDDAHFRAAAIPEEALWGPYTTDDQGKVLTVFGTEQGLRYRIPFADVEDVIGYLRDHATEGGERVGTMGDDGEKFGGWPTTWEHCWGKAAWIERFFAALEANRDWLTTLAPSNWLDDHGPVGRVYLPTGSYFEMGEWALPAAEALGFAEAARRAKAEGRPEARWLRGAIWRNFQVKYREVNDLHKQMLRASDLVDIMPDGSDRDAALDDLYAGQSNDCYWHGLFGGVYLPDLRVAALGRLIAAEDLAVGGPAAPAPSGQLLDLDLDGRDEALLATAGQTVAVKLDAGAGIGRWDLRAARHPLAAVMRRRPEAYHQKLRDHASGEGKDTTAGHTRTTRQARGEGAVGAASIHDIVTSKQEGLAELLHYDRYERRSGLVRLLPSSTTPEQIADGSAQDIVSSVDGAWALDEIDREHIVATYDDEPVRIRKAIRVEGGRLDPELSVDVEVWNISRGPLEALFGIEFAVMLLGGGHNPAAWHELDGRRIAHDESAVASAIARLGSGNGDFGIAIETVIEPAADAWISPIQTVSNSEGGFELVYQGSCVLVVRPISLAPGSSTRLTVSQHVSIARERSDSGAAAPA